MKVKLLHTTGNRDIIESIWDKPEPAKDEIEVNELGISAKIFIWNSLFSSQRSYKQ